VPTCLLAFVPLVFSVAVLIDVAASSRPGRKSWLLDQGAVWQWLESQPWDGLVTLIVWGVIAACGTLAIVAALLPGQRDLLPMWSPDRITVGYLSARSAVAVLKASAFDTEQVLSARVRLGRRRGRVSFRIATATRDEYDTVVSAVEAALQQRFKSFGLVRPVRLRVKPRKFRPHPPEVPAQLVPPEPATEPIVTNISP
jgi:hypothetical protein